MTFVRNILTHIVQRKIYSLYLKELDLTQNGQKNHKQCNNIIEDRLENEEENELNIDNETKLIQFPPAWDSIFPMFCYVPVPMHSLFLGCFQSLLKVVQNFFISRNCLKEFGDVVSISFMHVSSLNLEWLKV